MEDADEFVGEGRKSWSWSWSWFDERRGWVEEELASEGIAELVGDS